MIKPFVLTTALLLPMAAFASQFVEGTHYTQISDQAPSSEPKLTEFFSFYCHNCFNMETNYLPEIKANLKPEVQFDTKHVDFMNSDIGTEVMRSLAVIQDVDNKDKLTHAMFSAIQGDEGANGHDHSAHGHQHEPQISSRDDIKAIFAKFGVDATQYDAIADSKATDEKIALWRSQQNTFRVESVPSFIVNDKYAINIMNIKSLDELVGVINYLATEKDAKTETADAGASMTWLMLAFAGVATLARRRSIAKPSNIGR